MTVANILSQSNIIKSDDNGVSVFQRFLWICNQLFYQISAVLTVFMFWVFYQNLELNNLILWHIILCTAAYIPLMAWAIILFSTDNLWTQLITRTNRYAIHGAILLVSALAVSAGILVEVYNKSKRTNPTHFKSNHAILGLVSWILVLLSVFLGAIATKSSKFSKILPPVLTKFLHNFIGIGAYVIGIGSLSLELRYLGRFVTEGQLNTTYWSIGIVVFWSLLAAFKSGFNQLKTLILS